MSNEGQSNHIVLRGNDFELEFRPDDEEFNENYQRYCIIIKDNDDKSAESIKQQILENQEIMDIFRKRYPKFVEYAKEQLTKRRDG